MEKLTYYWKKLRQNKLAYNFVLIAANHSGNGRHGAFRHAGRHAPRRPPHRARLFGVISTTRSARPANTISNCISTTRIVVPAYEGGIVLDQLPEGGVEVKPGRTVYITINSFRQKMVPVPYVAGRSLRQAKNML